MPSGSSSRASSPSRCRARNSSGRRIMKIGWWRFPHNRSRSYDMPLKTFDEYVALAEAAHGHMCAGQILGLRLAIYGVSLLGIDDPTGKDRKRLVSFVEIDRCATDAVPIVTGCRMGKRALKFRDFGKVAVTFCDLQSDRAVRVAAKDSSKQRAAELYPDM